MEEWGVKEEFCIQIGLFDCTFWLWFYTFNTMCSVLHVSIIGSPVFREAKPYLHHQEKWSWHLAGYWHVQGERTQSNNSREMKMSISAGGSVQLLFFIIFAQINIQHSNLHSIVFLYLLHRWAAVRVQKYSTVLRHSTDSSGPSSSWISRLTTTRGGREGE